LELAQLQFNGFSFSNVLFSFRMTLGCAFAADVNQVRDEMIGVSEKLEFPGFLLPLRASFSPFIY